MRSAISCGRANRGDYISFVAPGVNLALPKTRNKSLWSGTSFASAYLAGLAGAIIADRQADNNSDVLRVLQENSLDLGAPGKDPVFGWGLARDKPQCK